MAKNDNRENVVELWGQEFSLTKNGLDEAQVVPFVNELISERDLLLQRVEHLSTLTKLAEKTIVEADKLAEGIKKEAVDEAKAQAKAILAKADEQAKQMMEEKRKEITTIATDEAQVIKANAEREAELLIEQQRGRIQPEIRNVAQQLYGELLSHIESLKQKIQTSEVEFEHKLSQPLEEAGTMKINEPTMKQGTVGASKKSITISDSSRSSLEHAEDKPARHQPPSQDIEQKEVSELEEKTPPSVDTQKEVELEILPPLDIKQIMSIMRHLDSLAEVENTELIPLTDKPLIVVSLRESVDLIELLKALPEVGEIKEITDEEDTGEREKAQIMLSGNPLPDNNKEQLNSKVYNTLSS